MPSLTWTARRIRSAVVLLLLAAGCGSGGGARAAAEGAPSNSGDDSTGQNGNGAEPAFIALNNGGGDLAVRMGGATFTGEAVGPLNAGTLTLTFDADGALTTLGGTVLGSFFGFPAGSEVVFDYQNQAVIGTCAGSGSLEEVLAESGQSLELRQIVVSLTGDSFSARTVYLAELAGQLPGEQAITVAATLRFETNDALQGTLELPGYRDEQEPVFTLQRL